LYADDVTVAFYNFVSEGFPFVFCIDPSGIPAGGASSKTTIASSASVKGSSLQVRGVMLGMLLGREKLMLCPSPMSERKATDYMISLAFSK
jgi:hypothetical protein